MADLVYLESAVALVLGFVGLKLGAQVPRHGLSPATRMHPACHASASGPPPHVCPGVRLRVGSNPGPNPNPDPNPDPNPHPDQVFGYELSSAVSLGVILSTLVGSVLLSLAADAQGNAATPAPAAEGTTSEGGGTPSDSDAAPSTYSPDAWTTGPR